MFGPYSNNKALCACGALTDLDSEVIKRKRGLGKKVECVDCRNRRIAQEHELLERHFLGLDEEED
jgi:cytochrome c-type biogenesis protein CcmH/NrfF